MTRLYIGDRLKALRQRAGLSQVALAKALGVHERSIQDWEAERTAVDSYKAKALLDAANRLARQLKQEGKAR